MYSLKYSSKNGEKRWICLETGCHNSVTTNILNKILKINGKPAIIQVKKHSHVAKSSVLK